MIRTPWVPRIVLGLVGILVVYVIVALAIGQGGPQRTRLRVGDVQELFGGVRQDGARLGDSSAPVTISVFNDLQCAPCRDYQLGTVDELVAHYARGSTAQLLFRNLSFGGAETTVAAHAAVAAGVQGREWQYVDLFFRNQPTTSGRVTDELLTNIANAIPEFDVGEWSSDRTSAATERRVEGDAKLADSLHLSITEPSVVVSGPGGVRQLSQPSAAEVEAAVNAVS